MKAIFDTLSVKHIMIEEGQNHAVLESNISVNGHKTATKLILDLSDLNRLFLKLNNLGLDISVSEHFECFETENGSIYTLDFVNNGWDNIEIPRFESVRNTQQIRA